MDKVELIDKYKLYMTTDFQKIPIELKNDRYFMMERFFYNNENIKYLSDLINPSFHFKNDENFMNELFKKFNKKIKDPEYSFLLEGNVFRKINYSFLNHENLLYKLIKKHPNCLYYFFEKYMSSDVYRIKKEQLPLKCYLLIKDKYFMNYFYKYNYFLNHITDDWLIMLDYIELFNPETNDMIFSAIKYKKFSPKKIIYIFDNKLLRNITTKNFKTYHEFVFLHHKYFTNTLFLQCIKSFFNESLIHNFVIFFYDELTNVLKKYCFMKYNYLMNTKVKNSKKCIYYNKYNPLYLKYRYDSEPWKLYKEDFHYPDYIYSFYKNHGNKNIEYFNFNMASLKKNNFIKIIKNSKLFNEELIIISNLYSEKYNNYEKKSESLTLFVKNGFTFNYKKLSILFLFNYFKLYNGYEYKKYNIYESLKFIKFDKFLSNKISFYYKNLLHNKSRRTYKKCRRGK